MAEAAQKAPQNQSSATPGARVDPFRAYDWKVQIEGMTEGHFMQCSGLEISVDTISYSEGGDTVEHKMPGLVHYSSITLEKGLTASKELWDWMQTLISKPPLQRKTVSILMLAPDGVTERLRWNLYCAFPKAWRAAPLNAASSMVAIQSLELAYERMDQD